MKKNKILRWIAGARALSAIVASTALFAGWSAPAASFKNPAGTWDCTMSGHGQSGIAFLQFGEDGSFVAYRLLSTSRIMGGSSTSSGGTEGRNGGGDVGRYPGDVTGSGGSSSTSWTNLIGWDQISGSWTFDEKGRVVGSFLETIGAGQQTCTTNENISDVEITTTVPLTNQDGSTSYITTNTFILVTNGVTITCTTNAGITNGASFVATVAPGKSISLVSSTADGKVTYRGIPLQPLSTDLSGNWIGTRVVGSRSFFETFTLESDPGGTGIPNIFAGDGFGADYELGVVAFVSSHNKVGFAFTQGITNGLPSSFISTLRKGKNGILSTTGQGLFLDSPSGTPMKYHAVMIPAE